MRGLPLSTCIIQLTFIYTTPLALQWQLFMRECHAMLEEYETAAGRISVIYFYQIIIEKMA